MKKQNHDIIDFHAKFFPETTEADFPFIVTDELIGMRLNFMFEELTETALALGFAFSIDDMKFFKDNFGKFNQEKALDGLTDLLYVLLCSAYLFGILKDYKTGQSILEEAWDRVHAANMKKIRCKVPGKRGTTFDVKKPDDWKHPDLNELIQSVSFLTTDYGRRRKNLS